MPEYQKTLGFEQEETMNHTNTENTECIYTKITKDNDRFLFPENSPESIENTLFLTGSGVKCNVCNIMRTSQEKWKSHDESKRHITLLYQL